MTGPVDRDPTGSDPTAAPDQDRPGLRTFSLEGRAAPGLYLVGWLASVLGGAVLLTAIVAVGARSSLGGLILVIAGSLVLGIGLIAAAGAQGLERRDRADLAYRGPSPLLVFAASIPLVILAAVPLALIGVDPTRPIGTLLGVIVTDAIWIVLIALTVVGVRALSWSEVGPGLLGGPPGRIVTDVTLGIITAGPVLLVTGLLAGVLVRLLGVAPDPQIPIPQDATDVALDLLAAAIVAPIGEEIFYRGFVTTAWARAVGPTAAVVRGGLLFALAHVLTVGGSDFDHALRVAVVVFVVRLPVGFALGWIFLRRRSLPASIALHATFNGALVLLTAGAGIAGLARLAG